MSAPDDLFVEPDHFSGKARLFPLPNLVLFPHVLQPLHIFEPRYCDLLEEALAGDRLITMGLLMPGWEADYDGRPPVLPVACLGRVASCQRLPDGHYNLLLAGLKRAAISKELPPSKTFREVRVRLKEDDYPIQAAAARPGLQRQLLEAFEQNLPRTADTHEQLDQLLGTHISLGTLTDILAYSLDLTVGAKQRLLSELDVDRRAATLIQHMQNSARAPSVQGSGKKAQAAAAAQASVIFPPGFSTN